MEHGVATCPVIGDPICPIFQLWIYDLRLYVGIYFSQLNLAEIYLMSALEWQWHKLYDDVKLIFHFYFVEHVSVFRH